MIACESYFDERHVMTLAETIGDRITILRKQCGWSQSELADRAGIDQARLSRLENNKETATVENLLRLTRVFDVDLHLLATGENLKPDEPDVAMTEEGNEVAKLLDAMDKDLRQPVVELARQLAEIDRKRRTLHDEYAAVLAQNIADKKGRDRQRAQLVLGKIERSHHRG